MKKLITIISAMLLASSALAANTVDWTKPYTPDANTLLLMHFDQNAPDAIMTNSSGNGMDAECTSISGAINPSIFWGAAGPAGFDTAAQPYESVADVSHYGWISDTTHFQHTGGRHDFRFLARPPQLERSA